MTLCINQALERSLEAWQEKQQRYQVVSGHKGTSLSEEESHILIGFLEATTALVRFVSGRPTSVSFATRSHFRSFLI